MGTPAPTRITEGFGLEGAMAVPGGVKPRETISKNPFLTHVSGAPNFLAGMGIQVASTRVDLAKIGMGNAPKMPADVMAQVPEFGVTIAPKAPKP